MTIVFKAKTTSGENIIGNRSDMLGQGTYNYMIRDKGTYYTIHFDSEGYANIPITRTDPVTISYTFNNGAVSGYNWSTQTSGNVSSYGSRTGSILYALFYGGYTGECWAGDFYWMYVSKEALTDEEIAQVIAYNEQTTTFELDDEEGEVTYQGGTLTTNLTADLSWTASTEDTWYSFTPETGEGGTTQITITIPSTNFNSREGHITFTDEEDNEATYTIKQSGTGGSLPIRKMYRGDRRIN
jgi:hypothetical protein